MNLEKTGRKAWTKPEVKRLGVIKDVAGGAGPGVQGKSPGS